jgi:extracellular factor (EF) 3-hydroxypalmitic acid methyl ester biosynthesis protein
MSTENGKMSGNMVVGQSNQGAEIRASLLRFTRYLAVFEIYNPAIVLRTSEVISEFKIILQDRTVYSGRAVVRGLVNPGLMTICEVTLTESSWMDVEFASEMIGNGQLLKNFSGFMQEWQKLYKVLPEFKVVIADMQSFLSDLRLWLDQVELGIRSSPSADRTSLERDVIGQLRKSAVPIVNGLFDRFEAVSKKVDEELRPAHMAFGKRQLHPLLLCSPFVYRTFTKPLGYAGDYEVVNMMFRDPCEGGSLFAKMINAYALQLPPIVAHQNRVTYLCERLIEENWRVARQGRTLRVFNLGCGPAHEIQQFFAKGTHCDQSKFVLADFNDETIAHTNSVLTESRRRHGHRTQIQLVKKTAQQLIKHSGHSIQYPKAEQYDLIYCAGLFDYLSDKVCRKLMEVFYDMLSPQGLLIATNVDAHPSQNEMEYFLEWHLIHRNTEQMSSLAPGRAARDNIRLLRDPSGINIFMEVRKNGSKG